MANYSTGSATTVWSSWSSSTAAVASDYSTTATATNAVWGTWTNTTAATTEYDSVVGSTWSGWVTSSYTPTTISSRPPETEEQRLARLERNRIAQEQRMVKAEELRLKKEAAKAKAMELLLAMLEEEQIRQLEAEGYFVVKTSERQYRIKKGRIRNVVEVDKDGKEIAKYCGHPFERVPDEDTMLAQKLMLETNEEAFLAIANRSPVYH